MKFKKLASAVAIFTILAGATAVFVSKNTDIMDRIGTLKQLALDWKAKAEGYEADLQAIREKLDLGKDATVEDIITAIDNKTTTETNTEVNKLYNELAGYLGLEAEEGHQFTKAEITQALEELSQVQDENGTLKAKLEKMISDINTANTEEEAQLKALNDAIGEVNGKNQGGVQGNGDSTPEVIVPGGGTPEQPTKPTEPEQPTKPVDPPVDDNNSDTTAITREQMKKSLIDDGLASDKAEKILKDLEKAELGARMTKSSDAYKVESKWVAYKDTEANVWKFGSDTSIVGSTVSESVLDKLMAYHNAKF